MEKEVAEIREDDEVSVTMLRRDWRIVYEFLVEMFYPEDWDESTSGKLKDEQLELIRATLEDSIEGK